MIDDYKNKIRIEQSWITKENLNQKLMFAFQSLLYSLSSFSVKHKTIFL